MGKSIKLDDDLYSIIKDKLNILSFKIDYRDIQGFVNNAVHKLMLEKGFIKEGKKK